MQRNFYGFMLTFAVATLVAIVAFALFLPKANVASADSEAVFPSNGYVQSEDPTLIAANDDYLLIFDETQNRLYVISNTNLGNYDYPMNLSNVEQLLAVGDKAFFVADDAYFSLDLTDKTSTPQEVTLATPAMISYLSTDGDYLYAKSSSGYISIYNDSFDVAFGQDNAWNDVLTGHSVVVGDGDLLYIFSTSYGIPIFTTLNLTNGETAQHNLESGVSAASVGDSVFFVVTGGRVACLDKNTGETILVTEIQPDAFSAYGRNLFTVEGSTVNIYTPSQDLTSLELIGSLKMVGNDETHFNSPVDIEKMPTKFAVADANNNRIAYFDSSSNLLTSFSLDTTPNKLAHDGNILYIVAGDQILKLNSVYVEQRYELADVADVLYLDKLYALKPDGVYVLFSGVFEKFYDIENAVALSASQDGTNVYILSETGITAIDTTGNKLPTTLDGNFAGVKDFALDYAGNFVIAYPEKVEVFENNITSLTFKSTTELGGDLRATLNACKLVDNILYFTADESYVGKVTLDVTTATNYVAPTIQPTDDVKFFTSNTATYTLPKDARIGNIRNSQNDVFIVFEGADAPQGYLLGYDGYDYLFLPENAFEEVDVDALSGEYVSTKQTVLFVTPNKDSQNNVVIDENAHVIFKHTTAGFDEGKWVVVEYNGQEYFALINEFSEYVPPTPERKHNYARAKGTRVGGIVNVYQSPSTDSPVILEVADGAKLEILETLDDFYKVNINGTIGYMTKDDVQLGGLTTVQIVAIVLAVLVLLAGSTVFMAIYFTKKKQAENE